MYTVFSDRLKQYFGSKIFTLDEIERDLYEFIHTFNLFRNMNTSAHFETQEFHQKLIEIEGFINNTKLQLQIERVSANH